MKRREFTIAASGVAFAGPMAGASPARSVIELRWLKMRTTTDNQMQRTSDFIGKVAFPALQRAGVSPLGAFAPVIAPDSPFLLLMAAFPSLAAMETSREKESQDKDYLKGREAYNSWPALGYENLESSLLRCFEGMPAVAPPPGDAQ